VTLTTRAFDLPDRIAAKVDPALISTDGEHFAALADSFERSIAELSDRLDAERRTPGGAGQAAMDRDLEVHRAHRPAAPPAPLRPRPLPRADGRRGRT
jgi:hypothetical protein